MKADKNRVWPIAAVAAFILLAYVLREALLPFFIAFLIAYLLDPLLDKMEGKKVPRTAAVVFLLASMLGVIVLAGFLVYPPLERQASKAIDYLPKYAESIQEKLAPIIEKVSGYDKEKVKEMISAAVDKMGTLPLHILKAVYDFFVSMFSSVAGMVSALFGFLIVPVAAFYFMRDIDDMRRRLLEQVPERYRDKVVEIFGDVNSVLSAFMRGQFMVAAIMSILYCIGLYLIGVPMWLFIGILSGMANIVPYLALIVGFIPAVIITYLHFGDFWHIVYVFIVYGIVQFTEGFFLTPRIMGKSIGLHPVFIMLAILIGGIFFGIVGVIIAVPVAAVIKVLFDHALRAYRGSDFYKGREGE